MMIFTWGLRVISGENSDAKAGSRATHAATNKDFDLNIPIFRRIFRESKKIKVKIKMPRQMKHVRHVQTL